jgi:hypothetical protein
MVLVVVISGAADPPVDKELTMKTLTNFYELLQAVPAMPETGWIFFDKKIDVGSESAIRAAQFFIAENELEEIELEQSKRTLVECPTLADIISVLGKRSIKPSADEYLEGLLYYRENDDFKE